MKFLLLFSRFIDFISETVYRAAKWLVLLVVVLSAGNALSRYVFELSSNAFLEIQWYLFAAIFLLCTAHTLSANSHVRVDVIFSRHSPHTKAKIDIVGALFFLLPLCLMVTYLSWDHFISSYVGNEMSSNAGGLIIWPVRGLIPVGFGLLGLQGISEIIKKVAFLRGHLPSPYSEEGQTPECSNQQVVP